MYNNGDKENIGYARICAHFVHIEQIISNIYNTNNTDNNMY
jgi:hypothetical protein